MASEGVSHGGVSPELAADLERWADDWDRRSDQPDHAAQAVRLVHRLRQEVRRHQFVYRP